jgi:flagellar L-ring protein precursor FlgH
LIEIDDQANISNSSNRARSGSENLGIGSLVGIPQILQNKLPGDASFDDLASVDSSSSSSGNGSVQRNEQIALKIAATVVDVLPNGHLVVQGTQEVRVNFELRDLQVAGIVRPEDISRQNTITYDKIAGARVSYGGRGQITDVQQPRYGQQVTDILLPF